MRICLDKSLTQIDCPKPKPRPGGETDPSELLESLGIPDVEQCPKDTPLYYVPPRPDHYHSEDYDKAHNYAYNYQQEYGDKWGLDHVDEKDE